MGRILTPEEIGKGQIPEVGAHQEAGHFLLHTLYDDGEYGRFSRFGNWGAMALMVYGSTTTGTTDIRSDVDVVIKPFGSLSSTIIETDSLAPFPKAMRAVVEEFKVHPEPHYLPGGHYRGPADHPLDPFYVDHLLDAQDDPEWSRNWPVASYENSGTKNLSESQLLRAMRRYLDRKADTFTDSVMYYDGTPDYSQLQRAFELPKAIGRKFARLQTGSTAINPRVSQDALEMYALQLASADNTRSEIAQHQGWKNPFSTPRADRLSKLIGLNTEYDEVLAECLQTGNTYSYETWLQLIYPSAVELAGRVAAECLIFTEHVPEQLSLPGIETEIQYLDDNTWDY